MIDLLVRKEAGNAIIYNFSSGRFSLYKEQVISLFGSGDRFSSGNKRISINEQDALRLNAYIENDFNVDTSSGPLVTGVMLTNHCNLFCKYCIANYGGGYSRNNSIEKNIDELIKNLLEAKVLGVLISGGEPTLSPVLSILLDKLSNLPFYITLDTNGVTLPNEVSNLLISEKKVIPRISLDCHIESVHNKNRGNYLCTLSTIRSLLYEGVDVRINTVLHKDNYSYMLEFGKFLISIGIKKWHIFKLQPQFAPEYLKIDDELAQKTILELSKELGNQITIICKFKKDNDGFASFVIDSDMNCFSTDNLNQTKCVFGSLHDLSMKTIWKNTDTQYKARHIKKYIKL